MIGTRTAEEIDSLMAEATECVNEGVSNFPSMSYEEGIVATLNWLDGGDDPIED